MDVPTVLVAAAIGFVGWLYLRQFRAPKRSNSSGKAKPSSSSVVKGETFEWPKLGDYDFEVVGESHYQKELRRFAGDHGTQSADVEILAQLVPEDDNPHDPKAVAVCIQGSTVGYLSRDDARSFRRRLGQKGMGGAVTTCSALIVGGGTRRNGEKLSYGIKLDIKPFE